MNALETELITSLWDGPRTGEELFGVFSSVVGDRNISFQEVIQTLKEQTYVEVAGYDSSGDELYRVTENGVEECAKYLHEPRLAKEVVTEKKERQGGANLRRRQGMMKEFHSQGTELLPRIVSGSSWSGFLRLPAGSMSLLGGSKSWPAETKCLCSLSGSLPTSWSSIGER